jgi:PAS domain S-box-containing protein
MSKEQLVEELEALRRRIRNLETALEQSRDELLKRTEERTRELQETNEALKGEIAERVRAEEALKERDAQLKQAQAMARVGVFIWDDKTDRCTYCSEELASLFGLTVPEFMATKSSYEGILSLLHPDDRTHYDDAIKTANLTASPYEVEFRVFDTTGGILHRRELGRPLLDEEGRIVCTFGTIQDITDTKRAEEALRESQSRIQDFAAASADWFWEMDAELRFTYMSANVEKGLGRPPEWYYGKTRQDILGEGHDQDAWKRHLRATQAHKPFRDFTYPLAGQGAEQRWLRASGIPVFSEDGTFVGYRGSGSDVTAAVQAERALRESEERYRNLVQLSPDGVILNFEGNIQFANPAAVGFLGAGSADRLIGKRMLDFVHRDFHGMVRERVKNVLETGETQPRMEQVYIGADGRVFDVESSATPITHRGKTAVLTVFRDITERKRAEEALRESDAKFREIFDESPVAMLEEDWRLGKAYDAPHRYGISPAAVELYRASSKQQLRDGMTQGTADPDELRGYGNMLAAFYEGAMSYEYEANEIAFDGSHIITRIRAVIPPKHSDTWRRLLFTIEDITESRNVEA